MSGSNCNMGGCTNYNVRNLSKSFFRFPRDYDRCKLWISTCNKPGLFNILETLGSDYLYKNNRICSDHFNDFDFNNPNQKSQGLKPGVIPSVNLPNSNKKGQKRTRGGGVSSKRCSFNGCFSNSKHSDSPYMKDVFFVPFAKLYRDPMKCEKWVRACGRRYFSIYCVKKDTYICSKHFVGGSGPTKEHPDPTPYIESGLEEQDCTQFSSDTSDCHDTESDSDSDITKLNIRNLSPPPISMNTLDLARSFKPTIIKVENVSSGQDSNRSLNNNNQRLRAITNKTCISLEKSKDSGNVSSKPLQEHTHDLGNMEMTQDWSFGTQRNYTRLPRSSSNTTYLEIVSTCCKNCSSPMDEREIGGAINNLRDLHQEIIFENILGWAYSNNDSVIELYKIKHGAVLVSMSIDSDLNLSVRIFNRPIAINHPIYRTIPEGIRKRGDFIKILQNIDSWFVCVGNNDSKYTELLTQQFVSGVYMWQTESLHSKRCEYVFNNSMSERCIPCQQLRNLLNASLLKLKKHEIP